jgi:hypothetical protein
VATALVGPDLDLFEEDLIRATLRIVDDDDRHTLWQCVTVADRAARSGDPRRINNAVSLCPPGPIRRLVVDLCSSWQQRRGVEPQPSGPPPSPAPAHRAVEHLTGLCCPTGELASVGYHDIVVSPDCFGGVHTRYAGHTPVGLQWRHSGQTVGLSRRWDLDADGSLHGEFWLPGGNTSRRLAWLADNGGLGMSVGVRFTSEWDMVSPSEWSPWDGVVDVCRHVGARVEEVSVTPTPTFTTTLGTVRTY